MKDKTTLQLANRLNEIIKETTDLELEKLKKDAAIAKLNAEWDAICYELWSRVPSLKNDVDLQPKTKKKVRNEGTR